MNKNKVYIETSIVSYLTARPSSDLLAAAWQKVTVDWWETQRYRFDLFASDIVIEEAGMGASDAAERRLEALTAIPLLAITEEVVLLSEKLIQKGAVPRKAIGDSLHIAVAAVHGVDYLLTWNYRHIDNAETKPIIRRTCLESNYGYPEICTPQELMGVYVNA
jgi:predicted nucleic acid-binding protein